jgi:hypothetical protein
LSINHLKNHLKRINWGAIDSRGGNPVAQPRSGRSARTTLK